MSLSPINHVANIDLSAIVLLYLQIFLNVAISLIIIAKMTINYNYPYFYSYEMGGFGQMTWFWAPFKFRDPLQNYDL